MINDVLPKVAKTTMGMITPNVCPWTRAFKDDIASPSNNVNVCK